MIKQIKLSNFRQHVSLELTLEPGFTALRGVNEAGKSTVLEAVMFAAFGIKACRNNDIDAWGVGKPAKVEMTLALPAGDLHIVRSRSGAEITFGETKVTGQTECTRFVENQLQLEPGLGPMLMIATQKSIQGVLDEKGGQEATKLIEDLADLAVVDRIIAGIQAKYPTGVTKIIEDRLNSVRNQQIGFEDSLKQLQAQILDIPTGEDIENAEQHLAALTDQRAHVQVELDAAKQARDEAVKSNDARAKVIRRMNAAEDNLNALEASRARLGDDAPAAPAGELDTEKLEADIRNLKAKQKSLRLYTEFQVEKANAVEGLYAGSRTELKAEISELLEKLDAAKADVAAIPQRIETLLAKKVSASVCGFCDKDVSQFPEVVEKNAELDKQITDQRKELLRRKGEVTTMSEMLVELRTKLNKESLKGWHDRYPDNFNIDATVCPEIVTWIGEPPADVTSEAHELDEQLAAVNRWKASDAQYSKQQRNLDAQISDAKTALHAEHEAVAALPACIDTSACDKQVDDLQQELTDYMSAIMRAKETVRDMVEKQTSHAAKLKAAQQSCLEAAEQVKVCEIDLKDMQFNNNLIKKLRTLRPEIANKVWNSVLGAVSRYFSVMRGTKSAVTRDGSMFLVDGKPVSSYSGSTTDVLGLALRVALIRTFLPTCNFMLLDEPFAACDDGRQTTALGFLASAGFEQLLVITHEDISETVADNLLTL